MKTSWRSQCSGIPLLRRRQVAGKADLVGEAEHCFEGSDDPAQGLVAELDIAHADAAAGAVVALDRPRIDRDLALLIDPGLADLRVRGVAAGAVEHRGVEVEPGELVRNCQSRMIGRRKTVID